MYAACAHREHFRSPAPSSPPPRRRAHATRPACPAVCLQCVAAEPGTCTAIANCAVCSDPEGPCDQCADGWQVAAADGRCERAPAAPCTDFDPACQRCGPDNACSGCLPGWRLDPASKRCELDGLTTVDPPTGPAQCRPRDPACAAFAPDCRCTRCRLAGWAVEKASGRCRATREMTACERQFPHCQRWCAWSWGRVRVGEGSGHGAAREGLPCVAQACQAPRRSPAEPSPLVQSRRSDRSPPVLRRCPRLLPCSNSKLTACTTCASGYAWSSARRACRAKAAPRPTACARKFPSCLVCNSRRTACARCASGHKWDASKRACLEPAPKPAAACARKFARCQRCNAKLTACAACARGYKWSKAKRACVASASKPRRFY